MVGYFNFLSEFVKLRNNYIHSFLLFLLVFIFLLQPFVFRDIKKLEIPDQAQRKAAMRCKSNWGDKLGD